jgi:hypothetical protein
MNRFWKRQPRGVNTPSPCVGGHNHWSRRVLLQAEQRRRRRTPTASRRSKGESPEPADPRDLEDALRAAGNRDYTPLRTFANDQRVDIVELLGESSRPRRCGPNRSRRVQTNITLRPRPATLEQPGNATSHVPKGSSPRSRGSRRPRTPVAQRRIPLQGGSIPSDCRSLGRHS